MQWTKTSIILTKCFRKLSLAFKRWLFPWNMLLFIMALNRICFPPNAWTQVESSFIFWCSPILFFIHMVGCIHPSSSVKYERSIYNEPDLLSKCSLLKSSNIWTAKLVGRGEQRLKASHQKKVKYCKWREKKWGKAIGPNISVWSNYACELTKR